MFLARSRFVSVAVDVRRQDKSGKAKIKKRRSQIYVGRFLNSPSPTSHHDRNIAIRVLPVHLVLRLLRRVLDLLHRLPGRGRVCVVFALLVRQAPADGQDVVHDDGIDALLDLFLLRPVALADFVYTNVHRSGTPPRM